MRYIKLRDLEVSRIGLGAMGMSPTAAPAPAPTTRSRSGPCTGRWSGASHSSTPPSPANIRAVVEGSLQRLGTDHIDLYHQHRVDPNTPTTFTLEQAPEAYRAMADRQVLKALVRP